LPFDTRKLGTADRFNDSIDDFKLLTEELKADIRDMEGAAVVQVAYASALPVYSIKAISDVAGSGSTTEQYLTNKDKALLNLQSALSAIFAAMTAILAKIGITGVESNLGTAIRTIVVLFMAWIVVFVTKKQSEIKNIDKNSWKFLLLSGLTTGLSWLCYYKALQTGEASIVVPIDKLSITITIALSYFILKEKLNKKSMIGLIGIVIGTMLLLI
jgi:uncharacterized membrane protein